MKFSLLPMLVFLPLGVFSQDINPNGYNKFYYPDGSLSSEGMLRDGKPDGFWKTYYPDGVLKSSGTRTEYQLDSTWLFFDERGDTTQIVNYRYGKKNGYTIVFQSWKDTISHNVPLSRELYVDDKKQGTAYYYYKSGQVQSQVPFKDNFKNGEGREYNSEGLVTAITTYKNNRLVDKMIINRTDAQGKKQGLWKTFYPDNKTKTEQYYKDDLLNGYCREYDKNGKELSVVRYINGELQEEDKNSMSKNAGGVKLQQDFYSDGTLKSSGGFKDGKPVGIHRTYNEKGKINSSTTYDDSGKKVATGIVDGKGREQGKWTLYDSIGNVLGKGAYKNGNREGEWLFFFSDGKTEQQGVYKSGKPDGKWVWYYSDGRLRRQENFSNGKEDGFFAEYAHNGDTIISGEYLDGEKNGTWITTLNDAKIIENYSLDVLHGDYKVYYWPENKIKISMSYLQGNRHGDYKEYYPDGKVYKEGKYVSDNPNGEWTYYTPDGVVETQIHYAQGEILKIDGGQIN